MTARCETHVGIVLTQKYAVFSARGKHAVRLIDALGDEIIDQHSYISFIAREGKRLGSFDLESGIDSRYQPLSGGFLITGGTVDLTGEIEAADELRLKCVIELRRVKKSYSIA